jgi:hypothetical protein
VANDLDDAKKVMDQALHKKGGAPIRNVVVLPRGRDGLFTQPKTTGPKYELEEGHRRMGFAEVFHYADQTTGNTRTFDPNGNYNCGACNKANDEDGDNDGDGETYCLHVCAGETSDPKNPLEVDPKAGSCADWEDLCAGDPELDNPQKPKTVAVYGVAKNGVGFGCHRCPFASKAFAVDSRGRSLFCGKGCFRVPPNACCALNGAPTL